MISTSPIKISCVVSADVVDRAVRALHQAFELGADQVEAEHPFGPRERAYEPTGSPSSAPPAPSAP